MTTNDYARGLGAVGTLLQPRQVHARQAPGSRVRVSSAAWFKPGVAQQRACPTSIGIASRAHDSDRFLLVLLPPVIRMTRTRPAVEI